MIFFVFTEKMVINLLNANFFNYENPPFYENAMSECCEIIFFAVLKIFIINFVGVAVNFRIQQRVL